MKPRRCGDIGIWAVEEWTGPYRDALEMYPDATPEIVERHRGWLEPDCIVPGTRQMVFAFQSYLVRTGRCTILIDGCVGEDKERPDRPNWHRQEMALARQPRGRRRRARGHRLRTLHPSPCRPCRLEHEASGRPLGAHLPQRDLSLRRGRVPPLGDRSAGGGVHAPGVRRQRAAGRRGRTGRNSSTRTSRSTPGSPSRRRRATRRAMSAST